MKKWTWGQARVWLAGVMLIGAAAAAQGAVQTYEMTVAPDAESTPMKRVSDGFGGAGEIPPAGLQGDGTGRFTDFSAEERPGFYKNLLGDTFTIDMRVRVNENPFGPEDNGTYRSMAVVGLANDPTPVAKAKGIRLRKDNIQTVSASGLDQTSTGVDLSAFRMVRFTVAPSGTVSVLTIYDLETPGGPPWDVLLTQELGGSGAPGEIFDEPEKDPETGTGGVSINGMFTTTQTTTQDFTVDWIRIDDATDLGANGAIISAPAATGCKMGVGPLPSFGTPVACLSEPFAYTPDGDLAGNGGWTGATDGTIAVVGETLKLTSSTTLPTVTTEKSVACAAGADGKITVTMKVKSGETGTGSFFYNVYVSDSSGNEMVRWQGMGEFIRARSGGTIISFPNLSTGPADFHDLRAVIDTNASTDNVEFFFGPDSYGTLTYAFAGTSVGEVQFQRQNASSDNHTIIFDDLNIGASPGNPLKTHTVVQGDTDSIDFTVVNLGADTFDYSVAESPDRLWLTLTNATGTLTSGQSATVTADIVNTGGLAGLQTVDLDFTGSVGCTPDPITVDFQLTVEDCLWEVRPRKGDQADDDPAMIIPWCDSPTDYTFEVENTGVEAFTYTITRTGDCVSGWMETDALHPLATSLGPVNPDEIDVVTVTWDPTGINRSNRDCTLTFTNENLNCEDSPKVRRVEVDNKELGSLALTGSDYADRHIFLHYQADVDPDVAQSAGKELSFDLMGDTPVKIGSVVADPDAVDGSAWRINTTSGEAREFWSARNTEQDGIGRLGPRHVIRDGGSTVVMRVKTVSQVGASGMNLGISDVGNNLNSMSVHADFSVDAGGGDGIITELQQTYLAASDRRADLASLGLGNGEYHTVRLAAGLSDLGHVPSLRVWVDEDPTPVLTMDGKPHYMGFSDSWLWGARGENDGTDMYVDYVTGTTAGVFAPGEEVCLGINLAPQPEDPPPTGACCLPLPSDSCIETTLMDCNGQPGTWHGYGIVCNSILVECTRPCCLPDGSCTLLTLTECTAQSGIWSSDETDCADVVCSGACCLPGGACIDDTGPTTCPGIWQGQSTICATLDPPCKPCWDPFADSDNDGDVDHEDLGVFQLCLTGQGVTPVPSDPEYCVCFDRGADAPAGDNDIDSFDYDAFEACASGPEVPADPSCDDL